MEPTDFYFLTLMIVQIVCCAWATLRMGQQAGWVWAILAFFFCQIAILYWGAVYWKGRESVIVMCTWAGTLLGMLAMIFL